MMRLPPRVSVVVATFNRSQLVRELLKGLSAQTLPPAQFEVVVVDDGSEPPVAEGLRREAQSYPFELTVLQQTNAGAAAARHAGILRARGEIIVIVDDDMQPTPRLLQEHVCMHDAGYTLVLGYMRHHDMGTNVPLFGRFHADQLERFYESAGRSPTSVRGVHVCTGNVSFRRTAYLEVGGFDVLLGRSEDRELGVRLEKSGAKLVFRKEAETVNYSDVSYETWWRRNFLYGVYDTKIFRKHPDVPIADPWHYLFMVNPVSRPLLMLTVAAPRLGEALARVSMATAGALDRLGFGRAAIAGTTLAYGLEYFRGVRAESGSLRAAVRDLMTYRRSRRTPTPEPTVAAETSNPVPVRPADGDLIEKPGYIEVNRQRIYRVHHECQGTCRGAVLLIGAMGLERTHAYPTWVRWGRSLARAGFDVLRFDYRGMGESEGAFEAATMNSWLEDARACFALLTSMRPKVPIVLHGLRMGALLASRMFADGQGHGMLLWGPPDSAEALLLETLRRKLAADLAESTGSRRKTRDQYIAELKSGTHIEVEGFRWSRELWRSAEGFRLTLPSGDSSSRHRPWRVMHLQGQSNDQPKAPEHVDAVHIPRPPFWLESRTLMHPLDPLIDASLRFVQDTVRASRTVESEERTAACEKSSQSA